MSTRSLTMVVDRSEAEHNDLGFACNPEIVSDDSCVNMYLHHDGYPEYRAVELANWVKYWQENPKVGDYHQMSFGDNAKVASRLVKDFHYHSSYLYSDVNDIDHNYTYVIWTGKSDDVWISCYNQYTSTTVFVLTPDMIIKRYKKDMEYTDWAWKNAAFKLIGKKFNENYKLNTKIDG